MFAYSVTALQSGSLMRRKRPNTLSFTTCPGLISPQLPHPSDFDALKAIIKVVPL
jgi:hypothetical protein